MLTRGVRIWLAMLGLLGGLIAAPVPSAADCCSAQAGAAVTTPSHGCCSSPEHAPPAPADDDRCKCPRPCCVAPAPVATIRLPAPVAWSEPPVGLALVAVARARSVEYHLDLMRPPRA